MNCDGELHGAYCHGCGQKEQSIRLSVWTVLGEWLSEMLAIDGKIWRTLLMIFRPGHIAKAYIKGRRSQFVSPLKLFLFSMLLAVFTLNTKTEDKKIFSAEGGFSMGFDSEPEAGFESALVEKAKELNELNPEIRSLKFRTELFEAIPWILMGLLPLFALLLKCLFPQNYYMEHLIVALNLHAVLLLSFVFGYFLFWMVPFLGAVTELCFISLVAVYFVAAFCFIYQVSFRGLLWRLPLLAIGYSFLLLVGLVATFAIVFWKV